MHMRATAWSFAVEIILLGSEEGNRRRRRQRRQRRHRSPHWDAPAFISHDTLRTPNTQRMHARTHSSRTTAVCVCVCVCVRTRNFRERCWAVCVVAMLRSRVHTLLASEFVCCVQCSSSTCWVNTHTHTHLHPNTCARFWRANGNYTHVRMHTHCVRLKAAAIHNDNGRSDCSVDRNHDPVVVNTDTSIWPPEKQDAQREAFCTRCD